MRMAKQDWTQLVQGMFVGDCFRVGRNMELILKRYEADIRKDFILSEDDFNQIKTTAKLLQHMEMSMSEYPTIKQYLKPLLSQDQSNLMAIRKKKNLVFLDYFAMLCTLKTIHEPSITPRKQVVDQFKKGNFDLRIHFPFLTDKYAMMERLIGEAISEEPDALLIEKMVADAFHHQSNDVKDQIEAHFEANTNEILKDAFTRIMASNGTVSKLDLPDVEDDALLAAWMTDPYRNWLISVDFWMAKHGQKISDNQVVKMEDMVLIDVERELMMDERTDGVWAISLAFRIHQELEPVRKYATYNIHYDTLPPFPPYQQVEIHHEPKEAFIQLLNEDNTTNLSVFGPALTCYTTKTQERIMAHLVRIAITQENPQKNPFTETVKNLIQNTQSTKRQKLLKRSLNNQIGNQIDLFF